MLTGKIISCKKTIILISTLMVEKILQVQILECVQVSYSTNMSRKQDRYVLFCGIFFISFLNHCRPLDKVCCDKITYSL